MFGHLADEGWVEACAGPLLRLGFLYLLLLRLGFLYLLLLRLGDC